MVNLADWGMYEFQGVLLQDLQNGRAMQVRLEPGRDDVKTRQVPADKINDVESDAPEWTSAAGYILATWIEDNSPVWKWLQEKGIDETGVKLRMLKAGRK
jgi:hypothetical protein